MTDYAHIKQVGDGWVTQSIKEHCEGTAAFAEDMASSFGAGKWAKLCGLWHDLGKYSPKFQQHITASSGYDTTVHDPGKVDHATAGALLAKEELKGLCLPIAYCICGHHSGLMDYFGDGGRSNLDFHLSSQCQHYLDDIQQFIHKDISLPTLPMPNFDNNNRNPKAWHLWVRMLFSCLVDADWLDTERFMKPEDFNARGHYCSLKQMKPVLDTYLSHLEKTAAKTKVNAIRAKVQDACREAGALPQGIYSLTVPTGGGKTLSSLLWAMEHAMKHDLKRIIIAIPYTSIVTQTADRLRKIFGEDNVIEHHSYADFDNMPDDKRRKMKLATENWDAPIIVTTNVQLFESLYSNKTSRCRKLHNIAKSVLILDEVQTLPAENLQPIIDILGSLSKYMGTSILFTTATQPAFTGKIGSGLAKFEGLESKEIVHDVDKLFEEMRRVKIVFEAEPFSYDSIAQRINESEQILCVVNTRGEAQQLYNTLPDKSNAFHLSRMMCQQHISDELEIIKERLKNGEPIKVISTQLIEAGVDIDFPVVWREMAGLDSIAQSAGRCNREGRLEQGQVHVFELEDVKTPDFLLNAIQTMECLLDEGLTDCLSPKIAKAYFSEFYRNINRTDMGNVTKLLYKKHPEFETASHNFKMIEEDSVTVYVPYEKSKELQRLLLNGNITTSLMRSLQRYTVNLPYYNENKNKEEWLKEKICSEVEQIGCIKIADCIYCLSNDSYYDKVLGIIFENRYLSDFLNV